jgi:class 3 adenylate cyclase
MLHDLETNWGDGESLRIFAPSNAPDAAQREGWGRFQRQSASPRDAAAIIRMNVEIDVRHVLDSLHLPTLILHRTGDLIAAVEGGRIMAERIPGARLVELPGNDHIPWAGDSEPLLSAIEEFLTGSIRQAERPDRILATVLFTDIVDSTSRAVELGDRRWRELLSDHHARVRRALEHHRGREVGTAGDGFFATFDGPARAIHCAREIVETVRALGIEVRAGLHTGECELHEKGVAGIAVHIGSRVVGLARASEVLVSSTVKDLVAGSGIEFAARGPHALKGIPDQW